MAYSMSMRCGNMQLSFDNDAKSYQDEKGVYQNIAKAYVKEPNKRTDWNTLFIIDKGKMVIDVATLNKFGMTVEFINSKLTGNI